MNFSYQKALLKVARCLDKKQYAVRGTASLVLQGLEMNVDDIDILADKETALSCNKLLESHLKQAVKYSETEKYKSYFGSFSIFDVQVEVMGDWQIRKKDGSWSQTYRADERKTVEFRGQKIWVTTPEIELKMFADMGRWNAYWKIKRQLQ